MKAKSEENFISYILILERRITPTKIDAKWQHSNLIQSPKKKSYTKFQVNMQEHVGGKCAENCVSCNLGSKKSSAPTKNDDTRNLIWNWKSYAKFQFNMSQYVGEYCNLQYSKFSSKRGMTPTKLLTLALGWLLLDIGWFVLF